MNFLEWLILFELIVIIVAAIFYVVALVIARNFPGDPIYVFCREFWLTFLYPPVEEERTVPGLGFAVREAGDEDEGPSSAGTSARSGDSFYGRVPKARDGRTLQCTLTVLVVPHADGDLVLGSDGTNLKVQTMAGAEDSAANKAVIQLVADALEVKPYQVTLTKGHYQARKTLQIGGLSQAQLNQRLGHMQQA